jgi:hypothetical protein
VSKEGRKEGDKYKKGTIRGENYMSNYETRVAK